MEKVLDELFYDLLKHEGSVSFVSWANGDAHIVNTWNNYLHVTDDERILIPAFGFRKTEKNVNENNHVKLVVVSKQVQGAMGMGTGEYLEGTAEFKTAGPEFDLMKQRFDWMSRVVIVTPTRCKRTI